MVVLEGFQCVSSSAGRVEECATMASGTTVRGVWVWSGFLVLVAHIVLCGVFVIIIIKGKSYICLPNVHKHTFGRTYFGQARYPFDITTTFHHVCLGKKQTVALLNSSMRNVD